ASPPVQLGEPGSGVSRYGKLLRKSVAFSDAPSVYGSCPEGASASGSSTPIATRSVMSTTSSPGLRPLGKPAVSPASTPSVFCDVAAFGAIDVLSRIISAGRTLAGLFRPLTPVRKAAIRSSRGYLVGALTPG